MRGGGEFMNLLVIRHSMAEEISQTGQDKDRPLSEMGRERFSQFCEHLSLLDLEIDLLLEKPFVESSTNCRHFL